MKHFIMAASSHQALEYCNKSKSTASYLTKVDQIRRIKSADILILPGAETQVDYDKIMNKAYSSSNFYLTKLDESIYKKLISQDIVN